LLRRLSLGSALAKVFTVKHRIMHH
jgi:hypothetical protein